MAIHPSKRLAKKIAALSRTGTPIRHGRAVVVSSTIGTSTVTPDGGSTNITAYNYAHAQPAAGAVVDLLYVGKKAYVIGSYDGDVPVGGLVASGVQSTTQTNVTSVTLFTFTAKVVAHHTYEIHWWVYGTAGASGSPIAYCFCSTSDGVITLARAGPGSTTAGDEFGAGRSILYTPTASGTVTVTIGWTSSSGCTLTATGTTSGSASFMKRVA